jgi:hypothetical protein
MESSTNVMPPSTKQNIFGYSDEHLKEEFSLLVREYASRVEKTGLYSPILNENVSATDILLVVCEMLRADNINMFDLMMWYDRRQAEEQGR